MKQSRGRLVGSASEQLVRSKVSCTLPQFWKTAFYTARPLCLIACRRRRRRSNSNSNSNINDNNNSNNSSNNNNTSENLVDNPENLMDFPEYMS